MTALLDLKDVSVSIDGRAIVRGASLAAAPGEFIGLIGPNGAGKSTLLRAAAGLIPIDCGARRLKGDRFEDIPFTERARRLAYLPQARPIFWSIPVRNIVALGRFAYGASDNLSDPAIDRAMAEAGVEGLAERPAAELSGGELARVHLARTLAAEAALILADEPITALDPAHQFSVMALLQQKAKQDCAIIAALHDLQLAEKYCTRLVIIDQGRIVADGPTTILNTKIARDVFSIKLQRETDSNAISLAPL